MKDTLRIVFGILWLAAAVAYFVIAVNGLIDGFTWEKLFLYFAIAFVLNLFVIPIAGGYMKRTDWSTGAKMLVGIFMTLVLAPLCLFRNAVIVLFQLIKGLFTGWSDR